MKHLLYLMTCLTGILIIISCVQRHTPNATLVQADSLMQATPDSALRILETINPNELIEKGDRAYYALLLTQAKDKNFIVQTNDSLIRIAVQYYDSVKDVHKQAKAYFYLGCVYRDANESGKAVKELLSAIPLAEKAKDTKLVGQIYNNTGYLYFAQNLTTQADSIFQIAERVFIQLNDTIFRAESLSYQGQINIKKGKEYYSRAEQKLLAAFKMTDTSKYRQMRASIVASLSSLYSRMREKKRAIQYAKLSLALQEDSMQRYRAYLFLGDAFYKSGLYDSATIYFNKSLAQPGYRTKAGAYMRLGEIAKRQGNIPLSLEFTELYAEYVDSMNYSTQTDKVLEAEQQVFMQQQKTQYELFLENTHLYYIMVLIVVILFWVLVYRWYRKKSNRKNRQLKQELERKENDITTLQEKINRQDAEKEKIEVLQKKLQILKEQRDALLQRILGLQDVYVKMQTIISDYEAKGTSKEKLTQEEWLQLQAEVDKTSVLPYLGSEYGITKKHIRLCCLLFMDLSVVDKSRVLGITRTTIYRMEEQILNKMGENYGVGKLERLLKSMIL